jgi:hypothetical protein
MKLFYLKIIFILFFVLNINSLYAVDNRNLMGLTLPLYSYPTDEQEGIGTIWDVVAEAATEIPMCIIFGVIRGSGDPVGTPNTDYVHGLNKLRENDAKILAYVETANAHRDIDQVKSDIRDYASNFDIDGIFFDEVSGKIKDINYYNEITNYAKSFNSVKEVMLNSSYLKNDFMQASFADTFLIFENNYEHIATLDTDQYENIDYKSLHVIIHSIQTTTQMQSSIISINQKNITNFYLTDTTFAYLPSFWLEEVAAIKAHNEAEESLYIYTQDDLDEARAQAKLDCKSNPASCDIEVAQVPIWDKVTPINEIVTRLDGETFDINGYYIHYDVGAFSWIYVDKTGRYIAKLEEGSTSNGYLRWTKLKTDTIDYMSAQINDDNTEVTFTAE